MNTKMNISLSLFTACVIFLFGCQSTPTALSSPESVINSYRNCILNDGKEELWSLMSPQQQARFAKGREELLRSPPLNRNVTDVVNRMKKVVGDDATLFQLAHVHRCQPDVKVPMETRLYLRVMVRKLNGRWLIDRIDSGLE
jgi:hypothetical protein